jgi:hypothetical protein
MKSFATVFFLLICTVVLCASAWGQTNPTAQSLPYSQDFSALAHTSTTYPSGWQGWTISTSPSSSFNTSAPTADRSLVASSTAATTSGNVHNYNGQIGFLNTGSLDLSVVVAINTTGYTSVSVTYDISTLRNPYDGTSNTRINEVTLQYRVGTSGSFTNLTGIEYQNNMTTQTSGTTPQNQQTKNITLPAECDNQAVVQLRLASRQVSGSGSRPSFAIDNVSISGTAILNQYRSVATGNWNSTSTWEVSTDNGSTWSAAASTPTDADGAVTIKNGHTVTVTSSVSADELTVESGANLSVNGNQTLTISDGTGTDLTVNGTLEVAGTIAGSGTISVSGSGSTVQINQGGWGGNTNTYTYDSNGRLVFNNSSGSYGVNSDFNAWPSSSGPTTVIVQNGGGMTLNTARTVGTLFQVGNGTTTEVTTNGNLTIGASGTCEITSGGYFTGGPIYTSGATLKINNGSTYGRGDEWSATSGQGYPHHVQISGSSSYDLSNNAASTARQMGGNLTIDVGSTFTLDDMSASLTVLGNVTNNGTLTLGSNIGGDLNIAGNYSQSSTFNPSSRAVTFNGTGTQTITASGGMTFDYLTVNKSSGSLDLNDDITVNNTLTITDGTLNTGSKKVTLGSSGSLSEAGNGDIVMGEVEVSRTLSGTGNNTFGNVGIEMDPQASPYPGATTINRFTGTAQSGSGNQSIKRYYNISPTTSTGLNLNMVFHYDDATAELNGKDETKLYLFRSTDNGSTWSDEGYTSRDAGNNKVTLDGVTDLSRWTASDSANPLVTVTPFISITGTLSDFGSVPVGSTSSEQTYTVGGSNLTNDITVTAPAHFQISKMSGSGFGSSLTFYQTGGTVVDSTVYVRFAPTTTGNKSSNITHTSTGATTQNQAVFGKGIAAEPTTQSTAVNFTSVGSTSMTINWTSGNGLGRLVVAKQGSAVTFTPTDEDTYGGESGDFTSAFDLGSGNKLVYQGIGSSVSLTNLSPLTQYYFEIFEFNGGSGTTNYLTPGTTANQTTTDPTYTWSGGNSDWATSTNWTPNRTSPAANDILIFNTSAVVNLDFTSPQTVGQLKVTSTARVVFTTSSARTLNIGAGQSGDDFTIDAGSTLVDSGSSAITISILTGNTGSVSGTFLVKSTLAPVAHRMLAADASSLTFHSGSLCQIGDSLTGNLFGNSGTTNTVIFSSGSVYSQKTGSNPFGLSQPSSKVTFQEGSWFKLVGGITPSFSGRTYANFEYDYNNGSTSPSGSNALSIDTLKVTNGTLNIGMTGTFNLKGDIIVEDTLNFNASSAATVTLNGTVNQKIRGTGVLTTNSNESFNVNNAAGVTMERDFSVGGTLTLTSGIFTVGANTLTLNNPIGGTATNLSAGSTSSIEINGTASGINIPSSVTELNNLTLNNSNGTTLQGNLNVQGTLTFTSGILTTSSSTLEVAQFTGAVVRTSGHVHGNLKKWVTVSSGTGTQNWEIGDATKYTPVSIDGGVFISHFNTTMSATAGDHAQLGTSAIDGSQSVNRFYSLSGSPSGSANVTFHFDATDKDGGADTAAFVVGKYSSGTWTYPTVGTRTTTSTQATGLTSFSDFAIGEFLTYTISGNVSDGANPVEGVTVTASSGFSGSDDTDVDGNYTITGVPYGSTGIILTPSKTGYTFDPTTRTVNDVMANVTGQDFTGTLITHTISGTITDGVNPMEGVTATASGGHSGSDDTDVDGNYTITSVPEGSTGIILTPTLVGYTFVPTTRTVNDITSNVTGQDFTGTITLYTITASVVGNGTITPSGEVSILHGSDTSFTITPDEGYHLDSVTVDGVKTDSTTSYTFNDVDDDHTIVAYFSINTYVLTVNIEGEGSVTKMPDATTYDHGTEVKLLPVPDTYWLFGGWSGDTTSTSGDTAFVLMTSAKSVSATFTGDPVWFTTYRTATTSDWATAVDGKGKAKAIKCKPDKVEFKFQITAPKAATGVTVKLGQVSSGSVTNVAKNITYAVWTDDKEVTYAGPVDSLQVLQLEGWGTKGKAIKASFEWATSPKATKGKVTSYILNNPRLPMPNLHNVGNELTFPIVIGKSSGASSVSHAKYKDVQKSLYSKGTMHSGASRCLDAFDNEKPIKKQLKSLPAQKHDNKLFAEVLTLGLNLAASEAGKFPQGFDTLIIKDDGMFHDVSLGQLFDMANLKLSCADTNLTPDSLDSEFDSLYYMVKRVNEEFIGLIDTVQWSCTSLEMTGVKALKDITWLRANPGSLPMRTVPKPFSGQYEPEHYALQQNYPNPFNPTTTIAFDLMDDAVVTLKIYNIVGQEIATLIENELYESGENEVDFDAAGMPSGVYFYRLSIQPLDEDGVAGQTLTQVKKMLLLK